MRIFITILALFALVSTAGSSEIGEDGLHKQAWFATTFKDVAEDLETARDEGKRLVMIFEQRGCVYCRKLHEEVLSDPEVAQYVSENFMVVQYNMFGDEEVTDLDGTTTTEKLAARKWRVVFTPTIMFMPEQAEPGRDAAASAVSVMPGAFRKGTTLDMFTWVKEKGYERDEHFQKYHARKVNERRAAKK